MYTRADGSPAIYALTVSTRSMLTWLMLARLTMAAGAHRSSAAEHIHLTKRTYCDSTFRLAEHSACPSDAWLDSIAPMLARPQMAYLNVGANKGFNINSFLQRFQRGWTVTAAQWHAAVLQAANTTDCNADAGCVPASATDPNFNAQFEGKTLPALCGVCAACRQPVPPYIGTADVGVLAVEMQPATHRVLARNFERFRIVGSAVLGAASNRSGSATTWAVRPGTEDLGIGQWGSYRKRERPPAHDVEVRMMTVDALIAELRPHWDVVDMLSIDTEGYDDLVLRGAAATLAKTRIVEFEYHSVGVWPSTSLWDTVRSLHAHWGFRCYWQGNARHNGSLILLEEACTKSLTKHFWSNVVCARDSAVLRVFDAMRPDYLGGPRITRAGRQRFDPGLASPSRPSRSRHRYRAPESGIHNATQVRFGWRDERLYRV